ncbi:ribonucleases P/MRP protein subunit pop7 [Lobosporangium transversale]|uniref:Ribonuclease P protein subunit p20-like protein n=1 Tax=Lobosporangium transversale TaxID=64571 RepID=A0A1Y2GKJ2_9FUNG|nr:ribonuclease P protein subunit p20-like protein [Lobosporangium transversale]KAF9910286.1 ribonucleases P/MRP protein subunit pop7 [Lobosporangium transversale]ORZ12506.1 ribonuclease P protein subunit p20-like protein [Lobosporangium transversale]|eukprot:XP_021880125.1 ribonuclease P protein subunit p20-like protein [Lobosporangium transversale]
MDTQKRYTVASSIDRPDTKRTRISKDTATIRKRTPIRAPTLPTDIYITTSSSYKGQLARAIKLLVSDGHPFITLHAMGPAIERAIALAMGINQACSNQVRCHTETCTVNLTDDLIFVDPEQDLDTHARQNSAVHIRIEMIQPMPGTLRELDRSYRGGRRRR